MEEEPYGRCCSNNMFNNRNNIQQIKDIGKDVSETTINRGKYQCDFQTIVSVQHQKGQIAVWFKKVHNIPVEIWDRVLWT